jgi:hypothetical protein
MHAHTQNRMTENLQWVTTNQNDHDAISQTLQTVPTMLKNDMADHVMRNHKLVKFPITKEEIMNTQQHAANEEHNKENKTVVSSELSSCASQRLIHMVSHLQRPLNIK